MVDVAGSARHSSAGGLLDLFEECQREEAARHGAGDAVFRGLLAAANVAANEERERYASHEATESANSSRVVEAFLGLVRREVRAVVDCELTALRSSSSAPSAAPRLCHFGGDRGPRSAAASSLGVTDLPPGHSLEDERLCSISERAAPSTSASSCVGSPLCPPMQSLCGACGNIAHHGFPKATAAAGMSGCGDGAAATAAATAAAAEAKAAAAEAAAEAATAREELEELRHALAGLREALDRTWKTEAELRAEGDQEVEARLAEQLGGGRGGEQRLEGLEETLAQVSSSVGSLARLQVELGSEAKLRQEADGRLQVFLKDFRAHVVGELEEMWAKHQQMTVGVEAVRSFVVQALSTAAAEASAAAPGDFVSPRLITGPDELEVSFAGEMAWGGSPPRGCDGAAAAGSAGGSTPSSPPRLGGCRTPPASALGASAPSRLLPATVVAPSVVEGPKPSSYTPAYGAPSAAHRWSSAAPGLRSAGPHT